MCQVRFARAIAEISVRHVNESFNQEIQTDYTHCAIRDTKRVVLQVVDVGTSYSATAIVADKRIATATNILE